MTPQLPTYAEISAGPDLPSYDSSQFREMMLSGPKRIKQYRSNLGLESLLAKPISKSAAIQRKGRAGREAPGQCYRLYTEVDYKNLEERTTPEILRCDLSQSRVRRLRRRGPAAHWRICGRCRWKGL